MQHQQFTLQANHLIVETLASHSFALELLDGLPQ
jgi:hypothetical protein